ncbi:MAG: hypothetical protein JO345_40560 [Streptosporangiaceae bacterium]|nr:hypothetical protein [Streptosporangiaceae bacterium]
MSSMVLFGAGFVFIGFFVYSSNGPHLRFLGIGFLTACAAFVVGCMVGLIVGIPRFVSSGALRHDVEARRAAARATAKAATAAPAGAAAPDGDGLTVAEASTDRPDSIPSSQLTPSTNLAEISDWLTKLLLGAGLVELTRLGRPMTSLANSIARAMQGIPAVARPPEASVVVAGGILALYVVLGFLDGYVITTVWYGNYLERLDYN